MYRKATVLLALPLLAACGGEDFTLKVDRSAATVTSELKSLDPNALTYSAGLDGVKTQWLDDGSVRYTLPNPSGKDGEVLFRITDDGLQKTALGVTVDIPYVTRERADGDEFLDEKAMERALKETLRAWERSLEDGKDTQAEMQEVSEMISIFAIGLQDFDQFETLASSALYESYFASVDGGSFGAMSNDWGAGEGETTFGYDEQAVDDFAYEDQGEGGGWGDDAY